MTEVDSFSKLKFTYSQKNKAQNLNSPSINQLAALKILGALRRWRDQRRALIKYYAQKMLDA